MSEEYDLSKSLKGKYGQVVPAVADANGNIFDGIHRQKELGQNLWTVKNDKIKTEVDRVFARMIANRVRREYEAEELERDIRFLHGMGFSIGQMSEITGISERTLYRYQPQDLKKPESEKISETMKAESDVVRNQLPTGSSSLTTQETTVKPVHLTVVCEKCHRTIPLIKTRIFKLQRICKDCLAQIQAQKPEQPKIQKPVETWTHRAALMQPQHSNMEQTILVRLNGLGKQVETDTEFCLSSTKPDFFFRNQNLAIYLDGPVHQGKEDKDEALRDLLVKRHGIKVISISYKDFTKEEVERVLNEVLEAEKW
jgi:very-short-patch-repair endonuclease